MVEMLPDENNLNPFPNGYLYSGMEDKLFKHVLFHTEKSLSKFRIKSIGHDWTEIFEVNTGEVKIPLERWDFTKDKFRIKAVLNESKLGVQESDWVSQQVLGKMKKRKLNQFRVRGISSIGLRSKWVYSELKDEDNELVVFQLLHDILDIMTVAHESDFTAIIETSLVDTLVSILNSGSQEDVDWVKALGIDNEDFKVELMEAVRTDGMGIHQLELFMKSGVSEETFNELMRDYLAYQDKRTVKIKDTVDLVTAHFKKNFMEQKKFSSKEIAEHARLFKLKDTKNSEVLDYMLDHIFLLTVEDAYEKAIEDSYLIALLQNDEEILTLLTDMYEFGAESTLLEMFNDVEFIDDFVTFFSDGLELLLEPQFDDTKVSKIREETVPTLLLMYKEVFIPLSKLDSTIAELFSDLEDDATEVFNVLNSAFSGVKFEYFDEKTGEYWTLVEEYLTEIFEYLLMKDDNLEKHFDIDVFSKMMGYLKKDSLKMFIAYDPVEAIQFIAQMIENIKIDSKKLEDMTTEKYHLNLQDTISMQDLMFNGSIEDTQKLQKQEDVLWTDTDNYLNESEYSRLFREETYQLFDLTNFKRILENYALLLEEGYELKEILSNKELFLQYNLKILDNVNTSDSVNKTEHIISHYIAVMHTLILNDTTDFMNNDFNVPAYAAYHLDLLYKDNLKDLFTGPFVRREKEEDFEIPDMFPVFYRYDDYFNVIWNMREDIHVHLGELDLTGERFSIGHFVLGTNTLEGEENQT